MVRLMEKEASFGRMETSTQEIGCKCKNREKERMYLQMETCMKVIILRTNLMAKESMCGKIRVYTEEISFKE